MKKYIICMPTDGVWNAASKARDDIESLALKLGYEPLVFKGGRTSDGSVSSMLSLVSITADNWNMVMEKAEEDSIVLVQYPHYPLKTALLIRRMIPRIQRKKNVRFAALVHDLNSVRGSFGWVGRYCDSKLLSRFDAIICHNDSMKRWLGENGIDSGRIFTLGLFDYLTDAAVSPRGLGDGIALAGNLSPEKCGYIMDMLSELHGKLPVHLYGNGFTEEMSCSTVIHHGAFPPEELPGVLEGAFGLVWDGTSADTCSGKFGEYLRINDPHKVSLYLASGMPVIIWNEAALAGYITGNGLGLAVGSIRDIPDAVRGISEAEYARMCENARAVSARLRNGGFFIDAMENVLNDLY